MDNARARLYLGVLSGTSADGLDVAAVSFAPEPQLVASRRFPPLLDRGAIARLGRAPHGAEAKAWDIRAAEIIARAVNAFIREIPPGRERIAAIGLHGQTIAHRPDARPPFSRQLGAPEVVSKRTALPVVANFRQSDMAAGGQGAPLAPLFHREVFSDPDGNVVVVNIGGIANVTLLSRSRAPRGWDCGPGNVLMDGWAALQRRKPYDDDGRWAESAEPDRDFLNYLMALPPVRRAPPKSMCAGDFGMDTMRGYSEFDALDAAVVMSTLCEWTAACIAFAARRANPRRVLICGGGALNGSLLRRIQRRFKCPVGTTLDHGLPPQWVEAALFAWLARQRMKRKVLDLRSVTGAGRTTLLGEVFNGR